MPSHAGLVMRSAAVYASTRCLSAWKNANSAMTVKTRSANRYAIWSRYQKLHAVGRSKNNTHPDYVDTCEEGSVPGGTLPSSGDFSDSLGGVRRGRLLGRGGAAGGRRRLARRSAVRGLAGRAADLVRGLATDLDDLLGQLLGAFLDLVGD